MPAHSPRTHTLATGHEVSVPLETEAAATAVILTADAAAVDEWLPGGLAPLRVTPGRTTVTLLSVDYRRIGDDAMDPYREVGVLLAATPASDARLPEVAALGRGIGGYVAALPVTTEPARALGDVWGYPKTVAEIAITDRGGRRRTALGDDGGHVLSLDAPFRPRFDGTLTTASFTDGGGLARQPLRLSGSFGVRPLAGSYSLGHRPLAERLRALGLGRSLCALSFDGRFVIGRGSPVGDRNGLRE